MAAPRATYLQQILTSRSIKFIVGEKGTCYTVHEAALNRLCPDGNFALYLAHHKRDNGHPIDEPLNESPKLPDTVIWDVMDEDVFVRLVEYAYQGDYSVPALVKLDNEDSCDHETASLDYRLANIGDQYPNVASFFYLLGKQFQEHAMKPFSHPNQAASEAFIDDIKQKDRTGYYDVFICHIKLYQAAENLQIRGLEDLCKDRLRKSLLFFPHCDCKIGDFFKVAAFVRDEHHNTGGRLEHIRNMLLDFLVIMFSHLRRYYGFEEVLTGDPCFAVDFIERLPGGLYSQWRA